MIIKPSSRLGEVRTYYFATKLAQIEQMNRDAPHVINLGIGSPDLEPPKKVIEALHKYSGEVGMNKYQSYRGISELRQALAKWYQRYFHTTLLPDQEILPLIGSKEGIMHIAMSFLEKGDQVLVPNPGYPAYQMTSKLAGAEPIFYDLLEKNNWLPDLEKLKTRNLDQVKIMWINYPHMPSGARADLDFYSKLVSFAKENAILICHDNPYGFILNDEPTSIFQVPGAREVALELNSLSKCLNMAGWRVGVLCGSSEYINTVMKFKSNMDSGMYRPIQLAAAIALDQGEDWYTQLNHTYRTRRDHAWKIMDLLACKYDKNSAGLFVWARVPHHIQDVEEWVERILIESRVFITPGFIFGTNGARYIRISLCNEIKIFETALERINQHVNALHIGI